MTGADAVPRNRPRSRLGAGKTFCGVYTPGFRTTASWRMQRLAQQFPNPTFLALDAFHAMDKGDLALHLAETTPNVLWDLSGPVAVIVDVVEGALGQREQRRGILILLQSLAQGGDGGVQRVRDGWLADRRAPVHTAAARL